MSSVVGGRQTRCRLATSSWSWTTRVERLQLRFATLSTSQHDSGAHLMKKIKVIKRNIPIKVKDIKIHLKHEDTCGIWVSYSHTRHVSDSCEVVIAHANVCTFLMNTIYSLMQPPGRRTPINDCLVFTLRLCRSATVKTQHEWTDTHTDTKTGSFPHTPQGG